MMRFLTGGRFKLHIPPNTGGLRDPRKKPWPNPVAWAAGSSALFRPRQNWK